jgi:endonuclease/exonuclease/phosphatase (EEP) superfamily protein YafD
VRAALVALVVLATSSSCADRPAAPTTTLVHANLCGGRCNAGALEAVDAVAGAARQADVVTLNEVCLPQLEHLGRTLRLEHAFSATIDEAAECGSAPYGNGVLAGEVGRVSAVDLPFPRHDPSGVVETRTVLCADASRRQRVCVTHLTPARPGPEAEWHGAQLTRLAELTADADVVVGDLNTASSVRLPGLADVRTGAGVNRLLVRGLRAVATRRVRQPRSDHPAVVVELRPER